MNRPPWQSASMDRAETLKSRILLRFWNYLMLGFDPLFCQRDAGTSCPGWDSAKIAGRSGGLRGREPISSAPFIETMVPFGFDLMTPR